MNENNNNYTLPSIEEIKSNHGAIFYDCDGVLTDNRVLVTETGVESVFFNRSDGLAIARFRELGIHQAIISTETNDVVERRAEKLRVPVVHKLDSLQVDKGQVLKKYCDENSISIRDSIFIGNDINDLPALSLVGYPCCPADAEREVLSFITKRLDHVRISEEVKNDIIEMGECRGGWISTLHGGYGVVRELLRVLT